EYKNMPDIKLTEAFEFYQTTLYELAEASVDEFDALYKNLEQLNTLSLKRHNGQISKMYALIETLRHSAERIEKLTKGSRMGAMPFEIINDYSVSLSTGLIELKQINKSINDAIFRDTTILLNTVFVILILLIMGLTLGVIKYVLYYQQFILKGFSQLEKHQYDIEALPNGRPIFKEDQAIVKMVKEHIEEEKFTKEVKELIQTHYLIDDLIELLFEKVKLKFDLDRIGIAFVDYSKRKFIAEFGVANFDNIRLGPGFEVNFSKTSLTTTLYSKESFITEDLEEAFSSKPYSASLKLLRMEGIMSNMVVPLVMGDAVFGMVFFSSVKKKHFTEDHLRLAEKIIYEISGLLNRAYFTKVVFSRITNSFAELVDKKDNETGDHIMRMVRYSVIIAEGLSVRKIPGYEVNRKFVLEIERNASAHDIGKVGIPDEILKKPGKLTPEEWRIMKTHAEAGADVFKSLRDGLSVFDADFYKFAEEIARYHHERWDGSGYPKGLIGIEIPLSARIVAVADVFDALTSKRTYKAPFSFEASVEMIKEASGTHFDPV
ncbi:MAG TPA: HD domain-containing phosphohydrolase, partial [Fusibacter sp.]|nr:HD domain-containing phosphohydrolase [Fusibacter sp.]